MANRINIYSQLLISIIRIVDINNYTCLRSRRLFGCRFRVVGAFGRRRRCWLLLLDHRLLVLAEESTHYCYDHAGSCILD